MDYASNSSMVLLRDIKVTFSSEINNIFSSQLLISYDTTQEFNVEWKAECGQINLAHATKNNKI